MKVYDEIDAAGGVDEWIAEDPDNRGRCDLCGEVYDHLGEPSIAEVGEFVDTRGDDTESPYPNHVIAHAQCGVDRELELA